MDTLWHIDLLGGLRLRKNREEFTLNLRTHKNDALLAYLAYYRQRAHAREELIEMLWPDSEMAAGRLSLRVALTALRRQLEPPGVTPGAVLLADHKTVQIHPGAVSTDVTAFEAALHAAEQAEEPASRAEALRHAVALYHGELLPGFYEEWILPERDRLADAYLDALNHLSKLMQAAGDLQTAIEYTHRALAIDRYNEAAHFRLIRLYAAAHRSHAAVQQYRTLEQILREELHASPSPTVRRFIADLLNAAGVRMQAKPVEQSQAGSSPRKAVSDTPPVSTGRLPVVLTRFFGRETEIARIESLLDPAAERNARLLTLLGLGGSGKTRLAIEAADRLSERYQGAVWFVALEAISDPAQILAAVADTLGITASTQVPLQEQVALALSHRPGLLILDNLEHLLQEKAAELAVSRLIRDLLHRASGLCCLTTSRQRLGIEGEHVLAVGALPIPDSTVAPKPLDQIASVQLFVDRTRQSRPEFALTSENAADVAALCARLDGIPLAIELAAGWVSLLTPTQILAQLCSHPDRLVSRRKDTPDRHQSLVTVLETSYAWLTPPQQRLLARLSVFRGCFDLEAAERICDFHIEVSGLRADTAAPPDEISMLESLAALQERCLIVLEEQGWQMQYRLLETVRAFAWTRLKNKDQETMRSRHAAYYLRMAEEAEGHLHSPEQKAWLDRLRNSYPDLEAALEWTERQEAGLQLAATLVSFWQVHGRLQEGRQWLRRTLDANREAPALLQAKALFGEAILAFLQSDVQAASQLCREAIALLRSEKTTEALCQALRPLADPTWGGALRFFDVLRQHAPGTLLRRLEDTGDAVVRAYLLAARGQASGQGEYAEAGRLFAQSLALYREMGDSRGIAMLLFCYGQVAIRRGDYTEAHRCWEESLRLYQQIDDQIGMLDVIGHLAYLCMRQADHDRAEALLEGNMERLYRLGNPAGAAGCQWLLGHLVSRRGDYKQARALLEESLRWRREVGNLSDIADSLFSLGQIAYEEGNLISARRLLKETLDLHRSSLHPDIFSVAVCLSAQADMELYEENLAQAESLYREALALSLSIEDKFVAARVHLGSGRLACQRRDTAGAEAAILESLALYQYLNDRLGIARSLEALVEVRKLQDRSEEAVMLYGASQALREKIGALLPPCDRPRQDETLACLRSQLGEKPFAAALKRGRALRLQELPNFGNM